MLHTAYKAPSIPKLDIFPYMPVLAKDNRLLDLMVNLSSLESLGLTLESVKPFSEKDMEKEQITTTPNKSHLAELAYCELFKNDRTTINIGAIRAINWDVASLFKRAMGNNADYRDGYRCILSYYVGAGPDAKQTSLELISVNNRHRARKLDVSVHKFYVRHVNWDDFFEVQLSVRDGENWVQTLTKLTESEFINSLKNRQRLEPIYKDNKVEQLEMTANFHFDHLCNATTSIIFNNNTGQEEYQISMSHYGNTLRCNFKRDSEDVNDNPCSVGAFTDQQNVRTIHRLLEHGVEMFNRCFDEENPNSVATVMELIDSVLKESGINQYHVSQPWNNLPSPARIAYPIVIKNNNRLIEVNGYCLDRNNNIDKMLGPVFRLRIRRIIESVSSTEFKSRIVVNVINDDDSTDGGMTMTEKQFLKFFSNFLSTNGLTEIVQEVDKEPVALPLF